MSEIIKNRVEESGLKTIDLSLFIKNQNVAYFDLAPFLFNSLILKEKDYRNKLVEFDWSVYNKKIVLVFCSVEAIIPVWAYMLAAVYLSDQTEEIYFSDPDSWNTSQIIECIRELNLEEYINQRVVIKGCGDIKIPDAAYFEITKKLLPVAKSILYGEPCSTVPVFKKR